MKVKLMKDVMGANDRFAQANRDLFAEKGLLALNIMGSPGCGKTTILEDTIKILSARLRIGVIEGDLFTTNDAERIEKAGADVFQINTGGACHLSAAMVHEALGDLPADELDVVFIENVGNLVCPADFDLGEDRRVTVMGITEGADKPVKYPKMFRQAQAILINKLDLLDYTDVNLASLHRDLSQVSPGTALFHVSARTGAGIEGWANWVRSELNRKRRDRQQSTG